MMSLVAHLHALFLCHQKERCVNREELLLASDLKGLVATLGAGGGLIGPSVYDTAQGLRFASNPDRYTALGWLAAQQQDDGGWGDPAFPLGRDASTVAAILALIACGRRESDARAIADGLQFLRRQVALWHELTDDIPLASELVLPRLVADAHAAGLSIEPGDYAVLAALGQRRRRLIARIDHPAGAPTLHSWEAWSDGGPVPQLDAAGSIGHSPAATIAWLASAAARQTAADEQTRDYLAAAAAATGVGIPGVLPTVHPYGRNEILVSLYTILLAGVLDHPLIQDALAPQLANLAAAVRPDGYGISDYFRCDGDLTAMALAILVATRTGERADHAALAATLRGYLTDDLMCMTYPMEMQRSRSATAHAAHAFALAGEDATPILDGLLAARNQGYWTQEKWHSSIWYLTGHAMHACADGGRAQAAAESQQAFVSQQRADGGWGATASTPEETAYAALGLLALHRTGLLGDSGQAALHGAGRYLRTAYRPLWEDTTARWTAKELYRPRRIARVEEVAVTLACVRGGWGEN
jgi:hypothetical protein